MQSIATAYECALTVKIPLPAWLSLPDATPSSRPMKSRRDKSSARSAARDPCAARSASVARIMAPRTEILIALCTYLSHSVKIRRRSSATDVCAWSRATRSLHQRRTVACRPRAGCGTSWYRIDVGDSCHVGQKDFPRDATWDCCADDAHC